MTKYQHRGIIDTLGELTKLTGMEHGYRSESNMFLLTVDGRTVGNPIRGVGAFTTYLNNLWMYQNAIS